MPALLEQARDLLRPLCAADVDDEPSDAQSGSGEPITFEQLYRRLYRLGTGWLQWSPEQTWNATPKEIIEAYRGQTEMLRAIYGSADDSEQKSETQKPDQAVFDRVGLQRLKAMTGRI